MTEADQQLAERVARRAGDALLALRLEPGAAADPKELGDTGDRISHDLIIGLLAAARPHDAILSEEGKDDPSRLAARRVWIVDPLDGTREYSETLGDGWRGDWAVHIALWRRGSGLVTGAVAIPARGEVFGTATPASLSTVRWGERPIRLAVSRSHPAPVVERIAQSADVEFVPMGSAGVKTMAVVTGEVDAYVHDGGQYEWDSAAPVAIAKAAGCVATRLDGSPLEYNRPDPLLPDLVISAPSIAADLAALIRRG